jgi:hypothetical protein
MSSTRKRTLIFAAAMVVMGPASRLGAQIADPPSNAPIQAGPLVLAPVLRLTNAGHDSNVFNKSDDDNPQGDFAATFSPAVDAWLRMAHGRASVRSQFDLYYFKQLTNLRAVDSDNSGAVEIPLNRVLAHASATLTNTRHRQNLEIDAIAKRRTDLVTAGMDVRLSAKATAGLFTRRSHLEYEANSLYLNTDLSRVLNHKSTGEGVELRYAVTPLTTLNIEAARERDRFDFTSDRNADNLVVTSGVTLNPRALISGSASIGIQTRRFLSGDARDFTGTILSTNLTYALLGRTRFIVAARRQLEYSYLVGQPDYVTTGATLTVMERLGDAWDVGGSVGRDRLAYRGAEPPSNAAAIFNFPDETVIMSSGDIAYNLGRTRVGFYVEHRERQTDEPTVFRGYQRLRIGSTVTYAF